MFLPVVIIAWCRRSPSPRQQANEALVAQIQIVMLAGFSHKAYQAMGDEYLMPAIAAVVIGGTNILGGRGTYMGTVLGTVTIVLLSSMLSVMQMPEAGRQIIYGTVIIGMLLVYGRQEEH